MKHRLLTVFLIFALLLTLSGCSAAGAAEKLDAVEDQIEHKLDAVEDKAEQAIRQAATSTIAATQPAPTEAAPAAPAPTEAAPLTKEEAEKIALDYVELTADQVTRLRTEYEIDDGIAQFDVEFLSGDWEYEFEIHAENGKILSFDKDHKYD